MSSSENEPVPEDDSDIVVICRPRDVNEEIVAKSLLEEEGIPFESRNEGLQDLFGAGQIGGSNLIVGPVQIAVPAAYAEEARHVLEKGQPVAAAEMADDFAGEVIGELEAEPPEIADHPNTAKVRRGAIISVLSSMFFFGSVLSFAAVLSGLFALASPSEGVPNHWRVLALAGTLAGLIGSWVSLTATG